MDSTQICLFTIRTLALFLFVLSAAHVPDAIFALYQQQHILSRFDQALLLIFVILSHLLLPFVVWCSAPFLSKKMLPLPDDESEPAGGGLSAREYFTVGIALIGLFLLITAFPLFCGQLYSLVSLDTPDSITASQRFFVDNSLRSSLFESAIKTIAGVLLFFKAQTISKVARFGSDTESSDSGSIV